MTLARAQREAGKHVEFLTFEGKKFGGQVRSQGFEVREVRVRTKIDPVAVAQMRKIIRAAKYDLVHTHLSTSSVNGCLAARLAKVPSIATVHGMSGKMSFSAATHLIAVSAEVKNHLVAQGVPAHKISVVYNGLDDGFQLASRASARSEFALSDSDQVVGTVGRVTQLKGTEDGIRAVAQAAKQYPHLKYLIVGDGDGLERCKALATELGIEAQVQFLGYRQDVGAVLPALDIFLFPTHKEAMGIALVEAMAAGLPCIATNVGGIPEVVTAETGRLVPASKPESLGTELAKLLGDESLRNSMSEHAKARVQSVFSASAMEQATTEVYDKVISAYGPGKVAKSRSQPHGSQTLR